VYILSAGSLENSFPDPAPGPLQLVHPCRRQTREFLPRSNSRANSCLSILSAARPRITTQTWSQSQVQPVHPLRSLPLEFHPKANSKARHSAVEPWKSGPRQPRESRRQPRESHGILQNKSKIQDGFPTPV
jgi:hypothetical protein